METVIHFVETRTAQRRDLLCRWAERLYQLGKKVRVATDSTLAAQHLDQLLWTFSDTSFVPHRIAPAGESRNPHRPAPSGESGHSDRLAPGETHPPSPEPVIISMGEVPPKEAGEALLCDSPVSLEYMGHFSLVVHFILLDEPEKKQDSRLLWQSARERGLRAIHVPLASNSPEKTFPSGPLTGH